MKAKTGLFITVLAACLLVFAVVAESADETKRMREAVSVIHDMAAIPEQGIYSELFRDAAGVAVIPGVIKAGFIFGGRFGSGVLSVRDRNGVWSPPVFVNIGGGSVGWQIGAEATDFILVFKTRRSIDGIAHGTFTLGVDATVAAGPLGRSIEANTDALLKAEILSYSRSRGLFAGISLEGAILYVDAEANAAFYKQSPVAVADILNGAVASSSPEVQNLREALSKRVPLR